MAVSSAWVRRRPQTSFVYFVWLMILVNLLSGGGYLMVDPLAGFGDWTHVLENVERPGLWKLPLIASGVAVSLFAVFWGRRAIHDLVAPDEATRKAELRLLCWGPYFFGSTVFVLSALFNPEGPVFVATVAAATFGGTAWLAWFLPFMVKTGTAGEPRFVERSVPWIVAGAASALFTVFVLGPSIRF